MGDVIWPEKKGKATYTHINLGTLVFLVIVVYLMAYMLTYIGKDKLAIYEVSASDIVDNIEGIGVIVRAGNSGQCSAGWIY